MWVWSCCFFLTHLVALRSREKCVLNFYVQYESPGMGWGMGCILLHADSTSPWCGDLRLCIFKKLPDETNASGLLTPWVLEKHCPMWMSMMMEMFLTKLSNMVATSFLWMLGWSMNIERYLVWLRNWILHFISFLITYIYLFQFIF